MALEAGLSADPLDILLRHDRWGTRRLLDVCEGLTAEQFQRRFDMGPGSLHDTLTHIIAAMRRWADRIGGRELRPVIDVPSRHPDMPSDFKARTPGELIALLEPAAEDLAAIAADVRRPGGLGLASVIEVQFGKTLYRFTRGAALVHVTTHGMHHRAQCLNMLRQLKVYAAEALPEVGVVDWQAETETGQLEKWKGRG